MFSFFKKLFNIQKDDTNPVKEDRQVKLETNTSLLRPETTIKITDIGLEKSFYLDRDNKSHQKVELSTYSSFPFNKTTSLSSGSNAHNFDNQINVNQAICQSQRRCSILAREKIKKVAEELSLKSNDSDSAEDEHTEQKSNEKLKLVKKKHRLHKRTIRICLKCRISRTKFRQASKQMNCITCGSILNYTCTKCKEKHYASYKSLCSHENKCSGKSTGQLFVNVGNNDIYDGKSARPHSIKTKKITIRAKKQDVKGAENELMVEVAGGTEKAHVKKATVVKAKKAEKFQKWTKKYCQQCQKPVMEKKMKNKIKCPTCSTLLQFECLKCHVKYLSLNGLHYHFKFQCFPHDQSIKKKIKYKVRSTNEKSLSSDQQIQQTYFKCDMCTYQTNLKMNLIRHISAIHMKIQLCCMQCPFKTVHRTTLVRHERQQHPSK